MVSYENMTAEELRQEIYRLEEYWKGEFHQVDKELKAARGLINECEKAIGLGMQDSLNCKCAGTLCTAYREALARIAEWKNG